MLSLRSSPFERRYLAADTNKGVAGSRSRRVQMAGVGMSSGIKVASGWSSHDVRRRLGQSLVWMQL
ncbi:hypothetical protein [Rubritalea tangerina]|uniref:hypothetical protein n=1 Tax=Rubritalea tangerina TaxID=430798 RepID=UPI0036158910